MPPSFPSRRTVLQGMGLATASLLAGCKRRLAEAWQPEHLARIWQALLAWPGSYALAREFPMAEVSRTFPERSLQLPEDYEASLAGWTLEIAGLVRQPIRVDLAAFCNRFPAHSQITRHDCVEGWSAIARWEGPRLRDVLQACGLLPTARYILMFAADFDEEDGTPFYGSLTTEQAAHPQVLLVHSMNGAPLTTAHGAPLRLIVPNQLGYKSTKFIRRIVASESLDGVGRGQGGYWEDQGYEAWAGI